MRRKARFDELFAVDLPNQQETKATWEIQIGRYGRDCRDFDVVQLAKVTEGLAGSEIENAFVETLYAALDGDMGEAVRYGVDHVFSITRMKETISSAIWLAVEVMSPALLACFNSKSDSPALDNFGAGK